MNKAEDTVPEKNRKSVQGKPRNYIGQEHALFLPNV